MLFDTHCHLQFASYNEDRDDVIKICNKKQMFLNVVGTQKKTSKEAVKLAEQHENIYASIGTHPIHLFPSHVDEEETSFISREEGFDEEYYEELLKSKKVIGIGETGLDLYHMPKDKSKEEVLEKQKKVFLDHVNFAQKHNLPLVIHCRDAHNEMIQLLQSVIAREPKRPSQSQEQRDSDESKESWNDRGIRGVVHCFTGNWEQAQKYLDLGLYLGFTGVVTFPQKKTDPEPYFDLREVLEKIPLDRILVETDAPYLAPQVCRGKRCEPYMVEEVNKKLAEIKGKSVEEIEEIVLNNALSLFTNIEFKKT